MKTSTFPLRLRTTKHLIDELDYCECAAWEDAGSPRTITDELNYSTVTYLVLQRFKTMIRIDNRHEAECVLKSLSYWSENYIAGWLDSSNHTTGYAMARLARKIKEALDAQA